MSNDPQHAIRLWMQEQLERQGRGSKQRLATFLKVRPDAITRMSNTDTGKETREISIRELQLMQRFFGSTAPEMEPIVRMVPINGLAGAGPDGSVLYATGDGSFGEIQAPDDEETVAALEVRGNSMHGLANDGWIIFHEEREPPNDGHFGNLCVCWLADQRVLVKIPHPSKHPGLFNLESANAPMMLDIAVEYFAYVTDIKTRKAAQRYVRRNPDKIIPELRIRSA